MKACWLVSALIAVLGARADATIVAAPGYAVHLIPTPGPVQGGVVRRSGAILVGQGSFGANSETVVRLDGGGSTTIATGFNSLGGFDLDATGTLFVADNGAELGGATTGDTLFSIPNALTRTSPVTALGQEVVPKGTIPDAQDVLIIPGGAVLVSDATGFGAGRVVRVQGGVATNFLTGFDYTAGLALASDDTLFVGDVDSNTFAGSILRFGLDGSGHGGLASGLAGTFDLVVDADGNILVSGIHTPDFSDSMVLGVTPDGTVLPSPRGDGFAFSTGMFFDATRDELLVLDSGAANIVAICRERDGDGLCDADDPCPAAVATETLKIGKLDGPRGDTLKLAGEMTVPSFSPAIDPVATGAHVQLSGAAGTILDVAIPGGAFSGHDGWKVNKAGTAWTYKNKAGLGGIIKVQVKTIGTPGTLQFVVIGKNGSFPVAPADLPLHATMAFDPMPTAGLCGEAVHACSFNTKGNTLHCSSP